MDSNACNFEKEVQGKHFEWHEEEEACLFRFRLAWSTLHPTISRYNDTN